MKKLPFIMVLLTVITAIMLPLAVSAADNGRMLAEVTMEQTLRPGYATNVKIIVGNPATTGNVILQLIAGSLIYVAGPLAVLMIAVGGLLYVTSHGEQTMMEKAKKTITWAIIGLIIIIVSYAIVINVIRVAYTSAPGTTPAATSTPAPAATGAPQPVTPPAPPPQVAPSTPTGTI